MSDHRLDWIPVAAIAIGAVAGAAVSTAVVELTVERAAHERVERAERIEIEAPRVTVERPSATARMRISGRPMVTMQRSVITESEAEPTDVEPLVYVDGVRLPNRDALEGIEPSDIDRIEIIKGDAALAEYGPAAEHGVVLVFLKDGVGGDTGGG